MVVLSLPHPTIDAIDAHYAAKQSVRLPATLSSRLLTGCERAGWYAFRWAHLPKPFTPRQARVNMSRDMAIDELATCLADIGVTVHRVDPKTYMVRDLVALDGHYRQRIGATAIGLLEAPRTEHLVYFDLQPAKAVAQIQKHGLAEAAPERVVPMQIGMHLLGLTRAFYMVRNKDSDELWSERVEYDAAHAIALLAKAERIRDASSAPVKVDEDPQSWLCRHCPAVDVCHYRQFALRTCRTCLHSTPVGDGAWRCARHDRVLSADDQRAGCPNHLYLPGLVPGEQVDAGGWEEGDGVEHVTYRLADGSTWIDGGQP